SRLKCHTVSRGHVRIDCCGGHPTTILLRESSYDFFSSALRIRTRPRPSFFFVSFICTTWLGHSSQCRDVNLSFHDGSIANHSWLIHCVQHSHFASAECSTILISHRYRLYGE